MSDLKYAVIILSLISIQFINLTGYHMANIHHDQVIAAVKDQGSSCHPVRLIKPSNKQTKDFYIDWGV